MALNELRLLAVSHETTRTGAPIVLLRFLEWLRAEHRAHIETLILRPGPLMDDFARVGPIHVIPAYGTESLVRKVETKMGKFHLERQAELLRMARLRYLARSLRGFDVLYCNSATSAVALRMLPEIPPHVIAHVHELTSAFNKWMDDEDRRWLLQHTSAFVVAADCVGQNLVDNHAVGPDRVRRCYEFIDPPRPDPAGAARARQRLGLEEGELVVGAVGTADWRKGADLFLQLAALVRRRAPDLRVRFVWVGRTLHWESIQQRADVAGLGLDDVVTFVGEVPDPASWVSLFDVFCLTSREDPYPLVCLEAAVLEVPVVTFDNGGMSELAAAAGPDAEPLLTKVPYLDVEAMADAVVTRLRDADLRAAEGRRLHEWVVDHHLSPVGAAEVGNVVADLIAARGNAPVQR
jgi:glycosyltransferase involved in cell wall biosynthesis